VGSASVNAEPIERSPIERHPRPAERPQASEQVFTPGRTLGSIRLPTDAETIEQYLETIEEPNPVYLEQKLVHPGMLLNGANWVLVANVVLPAWIHAESEIRHLRPVPMGEPVEVRARVAESFERKHRFAVVDVEWVAGEDREELVASGRHTVIWQLAEVAPNRQE
jgi:acyl-coenzyme A thioesterase PaaI-like protein